MKTKCLRTIVASVVGLGLLGMGGAAVAQYGPPPARYAAPGWDAPPQELRDFQRRGFLDGVQGAERDFQNHRIWNVNNRDEFRKPSVPWNVRGDYREGFKRGYYATVRHFEGGRGPL